MKIDLIRLSEDIKKNCPDNEVSYTAEGLILNRVQIKVEGDLVIYGKTRLRYKNLFDIVRNLRFDGVLFCTKEDLFLISSRPSNHSHTLN